MKQNNSIMYNKLIYLIFNGFASSFYKNKKVYPCRHRIDQFYWNFIKNKTPSNLVEGTFYLLHDDEIYVKCIMNNKISHRFGICFISNKLVVLLKASERALSCMEVKFSEENLST